MKNPLKIWKEINIKRILFLIFFPYSYKIRENGSKDWDYVFEKKDLIQFACFWFTLGVCFITLLLVLEELIR